MKGLKVSKNGNVDGCEGVKMWGCDDEMRREVQYGNIEDLYTKFRSVGRYTEELVFVVVWTNVCLQTTKGDYAARIMPEPVLRGLTYLPAYHNFRLFGDGVLISSSNL